MIQEEEEEEEEEMNQARSKMGTSAEVGFHTVIRWVIYTRTHLSETAHPQLHLCFEPLFRNCTDATNFTNVYKGTVCVCVRAFVRVQKPRQ